MNFLNKNKLYILPMKVVCNANCTWCVSKTNQKNKIKEKMELSEEFFTNFGQYINFIKSMNITKLEFTGGGEPFLNSNLQNIINYFTKIFPGTYNKLYTNGFIHRPIMGVQELNISRSHWDSELNKTVYRSPLQNSLVDTVAYFRPMVDKLRTCTVLQKGLIDSEPKALEMINLLPQVDEFLFRPMIPETLNHDHLKIDLTVNHPKARRDEIDCTCHKSLVVGPDGNLYYDFNLNEPVPL